jgi:hypothetical protein
MDIVRSTDGTTIAYDRSGSGPPLIVVGGALSTRAAAAALADALEALIQDPERAARLAKSGLRHVRACFDIARCLEPLLDRYRHYLDAAGRTRTRPAPLPGADPATAQSPPALSRP